MTRSFPYCAVFKTHQHCGMYMPMSALSFVRLRYNRQQVDNVIMPFICNFSVKNKQTIRRGNGAGCVAAFVIAVLCLDLYTGFIL